MTRRAVSKFTRINIVLRFVVEMFLAVSMFFEKQFTRARTINDLTMGERPQGYSAKIIFDNGGEQKQTTEHDVYIFGSTSARGTLVDEWKVSCSN